MNKVWEVAEKETREDSVRKTRTPHRRDYKEHDELEEVYDYGYDDGYSDAMKKIFKILRESD